MALCSVPSLPLCLAVLLVGPSLSCTAHLATGIGWYRFTREAGVSYDVNLFRFTEACGGSGKGPGGQWYYPSTSAGQMFKWTS